MQDYTSFDAMLEARLDALALRAAKGSGFSSSQTGETSEDDPLWQLIELALLKGDAEDEGADAAVSFDGVEPGLWAATQQECAKFLERALEFITHSASVRSPQLGPQLHTNIGWGGDATTLVEARVTSAQIDAHMTRVTRSIEQKHQVLRMLTSIISTAGRIAAMLATPAGAIRALPVAYRCVKDVWKQWQASQSQAYPGGTPWQ